MERKEAQKLALAVGNGSYALGDAQAVEPLSAWTGTREDGFPAKAPVGVQLIPLQAQDLAQSGQNGQCLVTLQGEPIALKFGIIEVERDAGHRAAPPLLSAGQLTRQTVEIRSSWRMFAGPCDCAVELFLGRRLVQPQFVLWDDTSRLDDPHAGIHLFNGHRPTGMLFADGDLATGADGFDFNGHHATSFA